MSSLNSSNNNNSSSNNNNRSNNTSTTSSDVAGGSRDGDGGGSGHTAAAGGVVDIDAAAAGPPGHTQPQAQRPHQRQRQRRAALGSGLGSFFEELLPDEVRRRAAHLAADGGGGSGGSNNNNMSIPYDLRVDQLEGLDEYLRQPNNASTGEAMSSSSSSSMLLLGCEVSNQRWSSNKDLPLKRKQTLVEYALRRMNFVHDGAGNDTDDEDDDDDTGCDEEEADEDKATTGGGGGSGKSSLQHQHQQKTSTTMEEDEDDDGGGGGGDEGEEEMMCETQPLLDDTFESQPIMDPKEGNGGFADNSSSSSSSSSTKKDRSKKKKKKFHHSDKIQPVDETTFDVTNFDHINLKTRNLTVTGPESQSLCRVLMLWPLRSTRRFFSSSDNDDDDDDDDDVVEGEEGRRHALSSYDDGDDDDRPRESAEIFPSRNHNALPRYRHRYGQDDGPAGVGHKHVISLEVEQQFFTSMAARATATSFLPSATSHHTNNKRMVIFLYDEYAWMVHEWLQMQQQKGKNSSLSSSSSREYIMDLSKIPAKCIFPYAIDPRSWVDRASLLEYCLCIAPVNSVYKEICVAARTSLSASDPTDGPEDEEKIRLDSADMRVRIASVRDGSTSASGRIMSAESNQDLVVTRETMISKYVHRQDSVDGPSTKRRRTDQAQAQLQNDTDDADQDNEDTTLKDVWMAQQPGQQPGQQQDGDDEDFGSYEPYDNRTPSPEPIIFEGQATRHSMYRQGQRCEYKSLKDLKTLMDDYRKNKLNGGRGSGTEISPFFVNIYAVVRNFTIPRRKAGLDWYAKLELIDETTSCANDEGEDETNEKVEPITLVAFRRELELLPKVVSVGDVIRIHRARLQVRYHHRIYDATAIISHFGVSPTSFCCNVLFLCSDSSLSLVAFFVLVSLSMH